MMPNVQKLVIARYEAIFFYNLLMRLLYSCNNSIKKAEIL